MIEELCTLRNETRSQMFRAWLLRAYNAQGSAQLLGTHGAPLSGRVWGVNRDKCNPMSLGGCLLCYPLGGEEE